MISNLDLSYSYITDDGLKHLTNMTHELNLSHCREITDEGL